MSKTGALLSFLLFFGFIGALRAQDSPPRSDAAWGGSRPANADSLKPPHRFWDQQNAWLFAGVGAARMLDYASTRHLRNQGNDEWLLTNSIVDNKPLFVGIELAGTAASVGVSYLFHRSGHHRLERWVSIVHIGVGVAGSIWNYTLKPPASGTA